MFQYITRWACSYFNLDFNNDDWVHADFNRIIHPPPSQPTTFPAWDWGDPYHMTTARIRPTFVRLVAQQHGRAGAICGK
jgi:hypothetical protein